MATIGPMTAAGTILKRPLYYAVNLPRHCFSECVFVLQAQIRKSDLYNAVI